MFAVIFELLPKDGLRDEYLALGARLKPLLESMEGFESNERFASAGRAGWVLSLSLWRDEKSVIRWRTQGVHHQMQMRGRDAVFADYHLRVGEVTADDGLSPSALEERRFDETETGDAKSVTLTEWTPVPGESLPAVRGEGLVAQDVFESLYRPGKRMLLASWKTRAQAMDGKPFFKSETAPRTRHVRIIRDYGMFDRREAPQYYPPAQ